MESRRLPIALLWILFDFVNALQVNVMVDDADPRITYTGNNWTAVDNCRQCGAGLDISRVAGASYHMAHRADSKAEFKFTGVSVSVHGVVTTHHWRDWVPPNVSFTMDGNETIMEITNSEGDDDLEYNKTLFRADNLPNEPHTLSIQTLDNSLFVLDYLTYARNASTIAAANGTESAPESTSTFPYDQSGSSSSTGTNPAVVGGIIGGIFGAFLIAGIVGLWYIKRANWRRHGSRKSSSNKNKHQRSPIDRKGLGLSPAGGKGKSNKVDSGSSSGGPSDRSRNAGKGGRREDQKRRAGIPAEYAYSGPKPMHAPMPLTTTRRMEALSEAANNGGGGYLSAISTFASSSSSAEDGKTDVIHALTTDTPQQAHPIPLYGSSQWPKRPNTADAARPFSSGSTLEVDGVLERVMLHHSNVPGRSSREEESSAVFLSEHPFRTMGS